MRFFVLFLFSLSMFVPTSSTYDYFQLVLQWPPGYCYAYDRSPCTIPSPINFTIHGLWPSGFQNPKLIFPRGTLGTLNTSLITPPLWSELHREWPDLNGNDLGFWSHEWEAHGIFSGLQTVLYFETTLKLKNSVDLLRYLAEASITPGQYYVAYDIFTAIWYKIGFKPRLWCSRYWLLEISICFDYLAQAFIDCPQTLLDYSRNFCQSDGQFFYSSEEVSMSRLNTTAVGDGFVHRNPSTTALTLIFCFIFLLV